MSQAAIPVTRAQPSSREIPASEVKQWLDSGAAVLVDVREPDEHAREHIAGSTLNPLSQFDAAALPRTGRVVVQCASGKRGLEALARAAAAGRENVYSLTGGINAWKKAGLPVERRHGIPISIMRQVQIVVGTVVLVCSVLAVIVSPWIAVLPALMGAGLVFAGSTGMCGMAAMLAYMPWNAAIRAECSGRR